MEEAAVAAAAAAAAAVAAEEAEEAEEARKALKKLQEEAGLRWARVVRTCLSAIASQDGAARHGANRLVAGVLIELKAAKAAAAAAAAAAAEPV